MSIDFRADTAQARWAFERAPETMRAKLGFASLRGAEEIARRAREKVPKVHSTLANSVRASMLYGLPADQIGAQAGTSVEHAAYVEEGTGPAAGRPRYYPNPDSLLDYLTNTPSYRKFDWARKPRKGAKRDRREEQRLELWFRSRALAMAIYARGTRPQPFMRPAGVELEPRVLQLLNAAAGEAVREVFGNG